MTRRSLIGRSALGPVVLDAGMGTRLIARGLDLRVDDPCLWSLTNPDAVAEIHAADLDAGADAVLTNTFGANRAWLARFGRAADAPRVNRHAALLARRAAGPARDVIGSVGPTAADDPTALLEQVGALEDAGVDALLFETQRLADALKALKVVGPRAGVPILMSLVAWPDDPSDAARALEDLGASALGQNCQQGMAQAVESARRLAPHTRLPLLVKPGGGMPGEPPEPPGAFAAAVPALLSAGVRFLGGCCGTTEAHVAALRAACYDRSGGSEFESNGGVRGDS